MESREYTSIQKFFWWLSGSEIHVLKNCKNDYNRHATTGAILLMTALVAFAAGSYAGWYFSYDNVTQHNNLTVALCFGLLWGCLIYTIDRMMVVSIKKDPNLTKVPLKAILISIIPRAILGIMIAFFISIPVEILIFSENIERQMEKDNIKEVLDLMQKKHEANNTGDREKGIQNDGNKVGVLDSLLNQTCPLLEYTNARTEYNNCNTLASQLEQRYVSEKAKYERMVSDNPPNPNENGTKYYYPEDIEQRSRRNSAKVSYDAKRNECRAIYVRANAIAVNYFSGIRQTKDSINRTMNINAGQLQKDKDSINIYTGTQTKILNSMKGFVTRFKALGNAASENSTIWGLLWLIRLIFIIIEILPTYNKLTTPIGDYDRAINAYEKIFSNHLVSEIELQKDLEYERRQNERTTLMGSEKERIDQEAALNKRVLVKVAAAQERVALDALKKWEEKEIGTATVNGSAN